MHEDAAALVCPAVPRAGNGTAGQAIPGAECIGTRIGTDTGTLGQKALRKLAFLRDSLRDTARDNVPDGRPSTVPATGQKATASGTALPATALPATWPLDLGIVPIAYALGAEGAAEGDAVADLPSLPEPGTPERARWAAEQAAMVRGLLAAASQRPSSWSRAEPHQPAPGVWCSRCRGRRWWSLGGREGSRRWRCGTCHPPLHLPADAVRWIASVISTTKETRQCLGP